MRVSLGSSQTYYIYYWCLAKDIFGKASKRKKKVKKVKKRKKKKPLKKRNDEKAMNELHLKKYQPANISEAGYLRCLPTCLH